MDATRTFKIHVGDDVRRFKLTTAGPESWRAFQTKTSTLFQGEDLVFKWKDSDGDLVTIANADDFAEAISDQPTGPVRFYASTLRPASRTPSAPASAPAPSPQQQQQQPEPEPEPEPEPAKALEPEPEPEPEPKKAEPVVHPHVVCDGTGERLVGTRYHKAGHNFDLCEAEFAKLPEQEKQLFEIILYPGAAKVPYEPVIHYGVVCDGSEATPIIGARFHKIGEDFDLCQAEFAKLDEDEKILFEIIVHPRRAPIPYKRPEPATDGGDATDVPEFIRMLQSAATGLPGGDGIDINLSQLFDSLKQPDRACRRGPCGRGWRQRQRQHQRQEIAAGEVLPDSGFGIGSFGPGVEQLQRFLIEYNLMDQAAIAWRAGLFGPWTRKAVSMFQKANKLPSQETGRYDEATRTALLAVAAAANPEPAAQPAAPPEPTTLPASEAAEVPPPPAKWAAELETLNAMGFVNNETLADLLDRKRGHVDLVIAELVQ